MRHSFATLSNSNSQIVLQMVNSILVWPFGQIRIEWNFYIWLGCCKIEMAVREWWLLNLLGVWGSVVKTYQSQVIPTAIQCCNHHLLINNPYWAEETETKKTVLTLFPFHCLVLHEKVIYWTVHLTYKVRVCAQQLHLMSFFMHTKKSPWCQSTA